MILIGKRSGNPTFPSAQRHAIIPRNNLYFAEE